MKAGCRVFSGLMVAVLGAVMSVSHAASLPGLGEVSGTVSGSKSEAVLVYLYNHEKNVGYGVFAVDGEYRATNMFPGRYEISVQPWYVPSKHSYEMDPVSVDVTAGGHSTANLSLKEVPPTQNYTGREIYPNGVKVQTYDEIYPRGPGRKILEHSCIVCHGVNFIPSKTTNRTGWEVLIGLMTKGPADGGIFGSMLRSGPPIVNHERLSEEDLPILLDYLEANFGPNAERRAVLQDEWPVLDLEALARAQYIEYRFPNAEGKRRGSHSLNFDQNGIVYVSDPAGRMIVRLDPETGESRDYPIPDGNSTHGIVVDGDGTVWFSGRGNFLAHLDPETGLFDQYQETERGLHGNTPVFTSTGDLFFTQLIGNKLGHWDRATDTITYYESPVPNASPYGMEIDHQDRVWYSEYFTGAITRFDPETKTFTRFKVQTWPNSLRRLGSDSKNNIWFGVYGYMGQYGRLGRIDAESGQMTEVVIPIKYGQPYDARPDVDDNIWISSMNYVSKYDPETMRFTIYPTLQRTDMPKLEVTRDGVVWYCPRRAGGSGYGGGATALYPDKDAITTLRAMPSPKLSNSYIANYKGPFTKVTGAVKLSKHGAQNEVDYENKTVGKPRTAEAQSDNLED